MNAWLESPSGCSYAIEGVCSIGRSSQNTIALADPLVSRRHALVHCQGSGEYWLVDLGSSNGVILNRRRISQPARLNDGDEVQIGEAFFRFRHTMPSHKPATGGDTTVVTMRESRSLSTWLLIADIAGSTSLSNSMPNDTLAQLVGGWFLRCKEAVERHRGVINKYLGDGFLAWWPVEELAERHVAALLAELTQFQRENEVAYRWILHYGEIRVAKGLFAGEDSLIGAEVNFAFRMEKLAGQLGADTLLSAPAVERLGAAAIVRPAGRHPLSGFDEDHEFYFWGEPSDSRKDDPRQALHSKIE